MEKEFWEGSWKRGDIGFHRSEVHPFLPRFFERLGLAPGERIFVPLCGKSLDMLWLRGKQLEVLGVELSPLAVRTFLEENGLSAGEERAGSFERFSARGITLLCGDLFELGAGDLAGVRAVYDRASLVALPPSLRRRYAAHLAALVPTGGRVLLVSYDYDQAETEGPPFAVPPSEIIELFGGAFRVEFLAGEDALAQHRKLQAKGVTRLQEFACLLERT